MISTWHADDTLLARYAAGATDDIVSSSIEAHVVVCSTCRTRVARHVPPERLTQGWDGIVVALDAPRQGPLERLLARLGIGESFARLLVATPTLRLSWLGSIAIALSFAVVATARPSSAAMVFVLVAPLVPLAGVAIAFSPALDPSADIVDATPLGGLPLTFLRTVASLAPSMVIAGAAGLLVAPSGSTWWAWLLPGLALSVLSLAMGAVASIGRVAATLGGSWAVAVFATEAAARGSLRALRVGGSPESALFQAPGQLLAALVAALAALAFVVAVHRQLEPGRSA